MHSYSQKCQSDQQRLEFLPYLSLTYRFFFPLYLFIYLNVHKFCAEHCCSIFLIFKVTLFAMVPLGKVVFLYCGHLKLGLELGRVIVWWEGMEGT